VFGALLVFASLPASADVVFSDSPASYNTTDAWSATTSLYTAAPFVASANYDLTQLDLGLFNPGLTGDDSVMITLVSDSSGLPGATIESWTVSSVPENCCTLVTVTPTQTVLLAAGEQYWVIAQATDPATVDYWGDNKGTSNNPAFPDNYSGTVATNNGTGWTLHDDITPAFDVLGDPVSPVPEPKSGLPLAAVAIAVMIAIRRRSAVS